MPSLEFAVNLYAENVPVKLFRAFEIGYVNACFEYAVDVWLHGLLLKIKVLILRI